MQQRRSPIAAILLALTFALGTSSPRVQARTGQQAPPVSITPLMVERNVIYGMYSGFALLMDVHRPVRPNGYGIVFVAGSGWQAPLDYGATPLKDTQIPLWGPPLVAAGYTVFAVNHRAAPRFHYPAAVEDVQRAVRFIRYHAKVYGIDPARLGGLGGSSGGHLVGSSPRSARRAIPRIWIPSTASRPRCRPSCARAAGRPAEDGRGTGRPGPRRVVPRGAAGRQRADVEGALRAGVTADARVREDAADAADARRRR